MVYLPIDIYPAGYERHDKIIEIDLDFETHGVSPDTLVSASTLNLVEVDAKKADRIIDAAVPFQLDSKPDEASKRLVFLLKGSSPAEHTRRFHLILGQRSASSALQQAIQVTDKVTYQAQESFKIVTSSATYYYHKYGAGFASMIDRDGHDWLSYRPEGGSDGKYRGIPNLVYPEGYFHPGGTDLTSRIVSQGPLKVRLFSETQDQQWACSWDIYPSYARLTVHRIAHPYWFLYEGTPGGQLDEARDFIVRSSGLRTPASERWAEQLPEPRWLYFGAGNVKRVLYLVHHESDGQTDSYWPMEQNMTVFGFGRLKLESYLTKTPACFTIGFAEGDDHDTIVNTIDSAYRPMTINVAKVVQAV